MNTVTQKLTRLKIFTAVSFILTATLGTACHFAFDFFGQSRFAGIAGGNAPISNRSLKKMFLSCYWDGAAFGELCGMAAVVVLFYGINGILGFNLDWVNIAIYFIAVLYAH